jgi:hypothetical protein
MKYFADKKLMTLENNNELPKRRHGRAVVILLCFYDKDMIYALLVLAKATTSFK